MRLTQQGLRQREALTHALGIATDPATCGLRNADTFQQSLSLAIDEINADLPAAAERLAPVYGVNQEMLLAEMSYGGSIYGKTLHGVDKLASAMVEMGLLSKAPSAEEYAFPDVEVAQ